MASQKNGRRENATPDASPEDKLLNFPAPVPPDELARRIVPDDDELALYLAEHWDGRFAFFYGEWQEYERGAWMQRHEFEVYQNIRAFLRKYRSRGVKVNNRNIAGLISMMRPDVFMSDRHINQAQKDAERFINLRNGLYDLETGNLIEHRKDLMMLNQLDFDYDPRARCPTFEAFLNSSLVHPGTKQTDHEMVAMTLQALGYSLTARTDLKASFWLYGVPDSGKSTLLSLIRSIMGTLSNSVDLNQLGEKTFMLAEIIGKRVVTFPEVGSDTKLNEEIYKVIVGGSDEVWTDVKGKKGIAFRPISKFWWGMNNLPRVNDRSGALFNRLKLIRFNRTFTAAERDGDLLNKIVAERSGIFNRLVEYLTILNESGWIKVSQSEEKLAEFRLESDTERTFLDNCCDIHPKNTIQSSELYAAYKDWCERSGFRPKNMNQVANDWRRLEFKDRRTTKGVVWQGVELKRTNGMQ